jgi:DNA-binding SARP family transcriptional activator
MSRLTLRLLGPPRMERDGAPVEPAHHKALALLAYLVVTRQSHSGAALAALLWPEADPSWAYANLRHSLWEIKQTLGEGWVVADRDIVGLGPRPTSGSMSTSFDR